MRDNFLYFPPFLLSLTSARLQKGRREIPLQPKEFALLRYLASHSQRLIASEELLQAVWSGVAVTPGVLKSCIRRVRLALRDNPVRPHFIETVHGRGYRFLPAVTTQSVQSSKFKVPSSSPLLTSNLNRSERSSFLPGTWNLKLFWWAESRTLHV